MLHWSANCQIDILDMFFSYHKLPQSQALKKLSIYAHDLSPVNGYLKAKGLSVNNFANRVLSLSVSVERSDLDESAKLF